MCEKHVKINVLGGKFCKEKTNMDGGAMIESSSSSEENLISSTSIDNYVTEVIIEENMQPHSVSNVLNYCKTKILNPYLRLLSIMGLRPLIVQTQDYHVIFEIFNYLYIIQITGFLIIGYFLQYMACFRRDRGFTHSFTKNGLLESGESESRQQIYVETCHESLLFSFALPSILHFTGYLDALMVFRKTDDDQLPILIERVFLSSSNVAGGVLNQKKLIKALWIFVIFSAIWMISSLVTVDYMMAVEEITFQWTEHSPKWLIIVLKVLLVIGTLWQDMVQATVISGYCLQAQLLIFYVEFLREKLLHTSPSPLEWIRDIEEFRKILQSFNKHIAPPVCIFTIINMSYAISGAWWLLKFEVIDVNALSVLCVSICNLVLWIIITIVPFIQINRLTGRALLAAMVLVCYCIESINLGSTIGVIYAARLTSAGAKFKTVGQEVRTRPFVHQDTPVHELNSILTYTASLDIHAKLFNVPIASKHLCFIITFVAVLILVLGQLHFINVNWF